MKNQLENTTLWNEAAKTGAYLGAVSIGVLLLKELAGKSANTFVMTAAAVVLWALQFFGCILLMKNQMLKLRERYEGVRMEHTRKLGSRAALLSGLLLASAQALLILQMPDGEMTALLDQALSSVPLSASDRDQLDGILNKLPLFTFLFQWLYCWLYGSILAAILSRYIFIQKLFDSVPPQDDNAPEEQ